MQPVGSMHTEYKVHRSSGAKNAPQDDKVAHAGGALLLVRLQLRDFLFGGLFEPSLE